MSWAMVMGMDIRTIFRHTLPWLKSVLGAANAFASLHENYRRKYYMKC